MESLSSKHIGDIFKFKQFAVYQGGVAMRVNTDGVLLGALVADYLDRSQLQSFNNKNCVEVLDIGTGTGVIALMIAQKLSEMFNSPMTGEGIIHDCRFKIDAIDIDEECAKVAEYNFAHSNWRTNLSAINSSLQDFVASYPQLKYDILVSNPPYFSNSLKNPDRSKSIARHTSELSYNDLILSGIQLLDDRGFFAVVLPFNEMQRFLAIAHKSFLYEREVYYIYSKEPETPLESSESEPKNSAKRVVVFLAKGLQRAPNESIIYLNKATGGIRSEQYSALTKEFYL